MSITYEEALSTLNAMFETPWTEEHLDQILRHFEGHMENTVDAVLAHGDGAPDDLLTKLRHSESGPDQVESDARLAQKIALEQGRTGNLPLGNQPASVPSQTPSKKGRGTPTQLPDDFLCIPGQNNEQDDRALARMLQDKLFAEELRNNPEFAHLSRGSGVRFPAQNNDFNQRGFPGFNRGKNQQQGPNVIEALSGMGENAKRRLQILADRFKANRNRGQGSIPAVVNGGSSERMSLLDGDDEQEVSFLQNDDYEMKSMSSSDKKYD